MDSLHAIGFYVSAAISVGGGLALAFLPGRGSRGVALAAAGLGIAGLYLSLSAGFAGLGVSSGSLYHEGFARLGARRLGAARPAIRHAVDAGLAGADARARAAGERAWTTAFGRRPERRARS